MSNFFAGLVLMWSAWWLWPAMPVEVHGPTEVPTYTTIPMQATGYHCPEGGRSHQCDPGVDDGRTATNVPVAHGICATDWEYLPAGSVLYVPGYGRCESEDRGSKIIGWSVDLYFHNLKDAQDWGAPTLPVTLVRWGR